MKISFRRITSSGTFIPEIDGLRFIAITFVVLFHMSLFISSKDVNLYSDNIDYSFLKQLLAHGQLGVPLFFCISGFILGIPFAKYYIGNEKPVNLKNYFLRRLTRLEPPYILTMVILFFGAVYVARTISLNDGILNLLASLIYSSNLIYGKNVLPVLNSPAWSLEIEVQFYILAPIMAFLFYAKSAIFRRIAISSIIILSSIINNYINLPFISIINFSQYFLIGYLLADFYVSKSFNLPKTKIDFLIGIIFFISILVADKKNLDSSFQKLLWNLIQLFSIFSFYYYVLFHKIFKFLSFKLITNIGGMCYSIYLLHVPVISLFGNMILKYSFSNHQLINTSIYSIFLMFVILAISSIFFLLIERPCMDKNWIKKAMLRINSFSKPIIIKNLD